MKNRTPTIERKGEEIGGSKSTNMKRSYKHKGKNVMRGRSLEAQSDYYNPATIKKQREFYKNAKYVNKFKKSMKQVGQGSELPSTAETNEVNKETEDNNNKMNKKNKKIVNKEKFSLKEMHEKKQQEEDQARMEREAIIEAKKEGREKAEARRKALKEKMLKKTRKGQPVMKYRIEHLLETIQNSTSK
ncbi:hypothetical protein UlMin_031299 [Ulmus minor]